MMTAALCLASVIYAEARGEPVEGQIAVGQVVINRVFDMRWPSDVCDVAYDLDQFANLPPDEKTIELAEEILLFKHEDMSGGATHFYSGTTPPWWAKKMAPVGRIGGHVFMWEDFPKSRVQLVKVD